MKFLKETTFWTLVLLSVTLIPFESIQAEGHSTQFANGDVLLICDDADDDYSMIGLGTTLFILSNSAFDDHRYFNVKDVFIFLGGGDDAIRVEDDTTIDGSLMIFGEDGDDVVESRIGYEGTLHVDGHLEFDGGPGDGSFLFQYSPSIYDDSISVLGNAKINCGTGMGHVYLGFATVTGDLSITTGSSDGESLILLGVPDLVAQQTEILVGGKLEINDGNGASRINVEDTTVKDDFVLNSYRGIDRVTLEDLVVGGNSSITSGWHADDFIFRRIKMGGDLYFNAGRHSDSLYMTPDCSVAGWATIFMANGNDSCSIFGVDFGPLSIANGGNGTDTIFYNGNIAISRFE